MALKESFTETYRTSANFVHCLIFKT